MLSDNDLELLSAYIDGALDESERTALEARLAADADLRRELERLRATVTLVNSLPTLAAPRDFTLTPRMVRRPPTILTSAAFSALSAAAAVVLLIVGAALFTTSMRVPQMSQTANQVALAPTVLDETMEDGARDVAREQTAGSGVLASDSPQPTQERPRDLLPTGTMHAEMQLYAAPESATRAEESDDFAADMAMNAQADGESAAMESADVEQATATERRMAAEPTLSPASASSGMAEAQPPAPGEAPLSFLSPSETIAPAAIIAPTETPTLTPSVTFTPTATSTETATPTATATLVPSPPPTATPPPSPFGEVDSAGIGIGLIVVALVLLFAAVVTTVLRRRL